MSCKISICIPTCNKIEYLKNLLESIIHQTFKDYEIIISDNSETNIIKEFIDEYFHEVPILYHKNVVSLSLTKSWNTCINLASGEWIKIMHCDSYLYDENSLEEFYKGISSGAKIIFSAWNHYYESSGQNIIRSINNSSLKKIAKNPHVLCGNDHFISQSSFIIHSSIKEKYDTVLKLFAHTELCINVITNENVFYINKPLLTVKFHDYEAENVFNKNRDLLLMYELLYIIHKYNINKINTFYIYKTWWLLYKNSQITSIKKLLQHTCIGIPQAMEKLQNHQKCIPKILMNIEIFSNLIMIISYFLNRCSSTERQMKHNVTLPQLKFP